MEENKPAPNTLEEAVDRLDNEMADEDKNYILENGSLSVHHSLGRWIRNEWGLWTGSPLKESLRSQGLSHPDDMSDFIINRFIERLKSKQ